MRYGNRVNFLISSAYFLFIFALCLFSVKMIPWIWPFLTSLSLAYIFKSFARKFNASSRRSAAAAGIVFYIFAALAFWLIIAVLISAVSKLSKQLPQFYLNTFLPYSEQISERVLYVLQRFAPSSAISIGELFELFSSAAQELVTELSGYFLSFVTSFVKRLPRFLIGSVFTIVSSFAISMDYENVTNFIMRQLPPPVRPIIFDVKNFLISCLFRIFKAYAVIMLITFIELSIGLWTLRIQSFWKYAAFISIMDILPVLGSGAVLIPWGIVECITGRSTLGIGLLILCAVIAVVRNIIEPRIIGDSLGLHPAVTLTAMFLGLRAYGIIGMIAAPIIALLIRFLNENGKIRLYK